MLCLSSVGAVGANSNRTSTLINQTHDVCLSLYPHLVASSTALRVASWGRPNGIKVDVWAVGGLSGFGLLKRKADLPLSILWRQWALRLGR